MGSVVNILNGSSTAVERSNIYNAFMEDIKTIPLLSKEDESRMLEGYYYSTDKREKEAIRNTLLKHNQRFVVAIVKQYANGDVDLLMDLISEGNIGFMEAIDKYNPDKYNTKLISWAVFYIRRAVNTYLYRNKTMVRQAYDGVMYTQLTKARNVLMQRECREVTEEEIFDYLTNEKGIQVGNARDINQVQVSSIDTLAVGEDDYNSVVNDFNVASASQNGSEEAINQSDARVLLDVAMSVLDEREVEIFKMLYGLNGQLIEDSMEAAAEKFKCTAERIRQLHAKGLKKMSHKLKLYLHHSN